MWNKRLLLQWLTLFVVCFILLTQFLSLWIRPYRHQEEKGIQNEIQMHMLYKLHIKPHLKICMFPLSRLTHWKACRLKSFYLNFLSKFFFISGISGPFPSSLFPFLHFTITGSFCRYDCGNSEKKTFYLPTYVTRIIQSLYYGTLPLVAALTPGCIHWSNPSNRK